MKRLLLLSLTIVCCFCLILAAPVDDSPGVKFLKYKDDKELEEIQKQIIAQYDHLGGSSKVHRVQTAQVLDPKNIKINL